MRLRVPACGLFCAAICLGLLLAPAASRAQATTEARLREALRSTTAQLRTLEEDQARAQAREAEQKKELESLRSEVAAARAAAGKKVAGEGAALKARFAEQESANARLSASLAECQKAASETAEAVRAKEEERARAASRQDALTAALAACDTRKQQFVRAGNQFIDWLTGTGSGLCEPFLGLKRVELENRAQDYRDTLLDLGAAHAHDRKRSRSENADR